MSFIFLALFAASKSPPCEAPAYPHEDRAIHAEDLRKFRVVSRERELAADIYLSCGKTHAAPEAREDGLAGIDFATAAAFAWMTHETVRGCALMERGMPLVFRARSHKTITAYERKYLDQTIEDFRHDLRDGRARWFGDSRRHPCAFDAQYASQRYRGLIMTVRQRH